MTPESLANNRRLFDDQVEIFSRLAIEIDVYKQLVLKEQADLLIQQGEVIGKLRSQLDDINQQIDEARREMMDDKELQSITEQYSPMTPDNKNIAPQSQNLKQCGHCFKEGAPKRCSRCKLVRYCDINCQKNDWSKHKNQCLIK